MISTGAPKVAAVWFHGRERGLASGTSFAANIVGGIAALAATNAVVVPLTGHWRLAFVAYGAIALLATAVWWVVARDRPSSSVPVERLQVSSSLGLAGLLRIPNVRVVLLLAFAVLFLNHGLNNWLPTVLTDKGMSAARAGVLAAVPSVVGIAALLLIPGVVGHGYRRPIIALLILGGAGSTIGISLLDGSELTAMLALSGLARFPLNSMLLLVLLDTPGIGARRMGAAGGIFFAVAEVGGFSGPFLIGLMRDITGTLNSGLLLIGITAAVAAPLALGISERRHTAEA